MPTNVSDRAERSPQLIVPPLWRSWLEDACEITRVKSRRSTLEPEQAPVYEQQTAWQPPISNLRHRDASDRVSLPFPVCESWSKLLSFRTFNVFRRANGSLPAHSSSFLICGFACATAMRGATSSQCNSRARSPQMKRG